MHSRARLSARMLAFFTHTHVRCWQRAGKRLISVELLHKWARQDKKNCCSNTSRNWQQKRRAARVIKRMIYIDVLRKNKRFSSIFIALAPTRQRERVKNLSAKNRKTSECRTVFFLKILSPSHMKKGLESSFHDEVNHLAREFLVVVVAANLVPRINLMWRNSKCFN